MKSKVSVLYLLLLSFISYAQEIPEETNTIKNQFDEIYRISSSYQIYKVVSKEKYKQLKENVLDSLKAVEEQLYKKEALLKNNNNEIIKTQELLSKTQVKLEDSIIRENSISLFGIQLSKTTYNLILWLIILGLLIGLSYFIFKFFKSNVLTKEAENSLIEVEKEFEIHRKKSLEREQVLRRKLQDEINKQRNS